MSTKVKRNIIQVRLSDDELKAFIKVKNRMNAPNNSEAVRTMIADERLVNIAANRVKNGDRSVAQFLAKAWADLGRSDLAQAALGLQNVNGSASIQKIETIYSDLQAQLSGLLYDATSMSNNINQLAHAANLAKQEDPSDPDTWNWIIDSLSQLLSVASNLQKATTDIRKSIKHTDNED